MASVISLAFFAYLFLFSILFAFFLFAFGCAFSLPLYPLPLWGDRLLTPSGYAKEPVSLYPFLASLSLHRRCTTKGDRRRAYPIPLAPVPLYPYAPVPLLPQRGTGYVRRQRRRGTG